MNAGLELLQEKTSIIDRVAASTVGIREVLQELKNLLHKLEERKKTDEIDEDFVEEIEELPPSEEAKDDQHVNEDDADRVASQYDYVEGIVSRLCRDVSFLYHVLMYLCANVQNPANQLKKCKLTAKKATLEWKWLPGLER